MSELSTQHKHAHTATVLGPIVAAFAALCCFGAAPLLAGLAAVGLGFMIHDAILVPLLAAAMGASIWALNRDRPRHGDRRPLTLAAIALPLAVGGLWVSALIVALGLVLLVAGSVWNFMLIRHTKGLAKPDA